MGKGLPRNGAPFPFLSDPHGVRRPRRRTGHSFSSVSQGPLKIDATLSGDAERSNYLIPPPFFFPLVKFQNGYSCHQATQQPGLVPLWLLAHDLLSEMQNTTREFTGRRMQGAEYNSYGFIVISFMKDKSFVIEVTAKE